LPERTDVSVLAFSALSMLFLCEKELPGNKEDLNNERCIDFMPSLHAREQFIAIYYAISAWY